MSEVVEQLDAPSQEIVTPDQTMEQVQEVETNEVEAPKEDPQDKNWKAARLKMDEQTRQIHILQHELEQIRNHASTKEVPKESEEDEFLTDSERKLFREIKTLKKEVEKNKSRDADHVVDRLRAKYADFDDVMNPENISYLKSNNPSLAKALISLRDEPYEQGLAAYDALKNTQWYQQRHTMEDKARMEQNIKKPVSIQSVRKQGALSDANRFANGLTPELKKSLLKEMAEARKGA